MIDLRDTTSLTAAVERMKPSATTLVDTFFPLVPATSYSTNIEIHFRKGQRRLAPFIVRGAKGVIVDRDDFKSQIYTPPMMGPSRVISPEMLQTRGFGENVSSTKTPAQRADEMQARDLVELLNMVQNRKNKMAADILTTGKCVIKGFGDDGKEAVTDTVDYGWDQKIVPATTWDKAGATIYDDIRNASMKIQENAGMVPTVMLVGKNVANYMLSNDHILKFLNVPLASNLSMFSFQPRIVSPQVMLVGRIASLNLEVYNYMETYLDDDNTVKPFLGDDDVIIGIPGRGRQLHGAITLVDDSERGISTYADPYVPYFNASKDSQQLKLSMYCRCILAPETVDDFACIKTKGE